MAPKSDELREMENKLRGVMDFYVSTYFEYYSTQIKNEIAKQNAFVERDIMDARIDDHIKEVIEEATGKFHDVCMLILDSLMSGRVEEIRRFEVLFLDLMKRTLLKDMEDSKRGVTPIIIVADERAKAKEN